MTIAVCTTTATRDDALVIARACVSAGLVACAHIDAIDSVYVWEGKLNEDQEFRLMLKASDAALEKIKKTITELHSYDEPAIYVFPITGGSTSYLAWVEAHSKG